MGIIITSDQAWMGITLNTQQDNEGIHYSVFPANRLLPIVPGDYPQDITKYRG